ncbi:MAG TPA: Hsp70 family protein [Myxococcaceae bacterium]|nr:Hsp70 family protein [Myxococcaceae bacterium]
MSSRHIVGIDLGTTHSAMAQVIPSEGGAQAEVLDVPVPQLVRPGEWRPESLLPSALFLPAEGEFDPALLRLPWGGDEHVITGALAQVQGARVPGRLVASAKSWLSHPGVDRNAPILPWGAAPDVPKMSPVEASRRLLAHLRDTWDHAHPDQPLAEQEVVLTVPASFDEAARALTVSAARLAGLNRFTLLEEPQAAFYDFTARHRQALEKTLGEVRLVLVVDVGGGTTDFTLVHAGVSPEGPMLKRIAVGDHLMLGGDNMDVLLAHRLESRWLGEGKRLSGAQWPQAVSAARSAKEALLADGAPEQLPVTLAGSGSRLLGGSLSATLTRAEVEALVLDGFFPRIAPTERPTRSARVALQELGLPYAQEPAITRHLAGFLAAHAAAGFRALSQESPAEGALPRPDAILLNGGVFNAPGIAARVVEAVSAWWPDAPPIRLLSHGSLDRSVARGAAYYGLVRRGLGRRIGGGAARAYYVGLDAGSGSASELEAGPQVLCLIPRGFEEGERVRIPERTFRLAMEQPVQFPLFSTTADRIDAPGAVVPLGDDLQPLPPLHTILRSADPSVKERRVSIEAGLTEIGTLELSLVSDESDERWRLEFELRGAGRAGRLAVTESMPPRFAEAREAIDRIYGHRPLPVGPKDVKALWRTLEKSLGARETWRVPVLRELWGAMYAGIGKRRRSPDHERIAYALLGYGLRPGFGYPLDAWRAEQTFRLFKDLVTAHGEKPVWIEYWVMWRRISGGLAPEAQHTLYEWLAPHLERRLVPPKGKVPKLKGIQPEGLDEMVRAAASFEHLEPFQKLQLGGWIIEWLRTQKPPGGPWAWSLGRLGARVPLYGSGHRVIPVEDAVAWVELLLELGLRKLDGAPFAVTQLTRRTGDRTRDLPEELRERVLTELAKVNAPEAWRRMVAEVVELEAADEARALGDTLPAGLRL